MRHVPWSSPRRPATSSSCHRPCTDNRAAAMTICQPDGRTGSCRWSLLARDMSYFVIDGFPFASLLARSLFPHPNKTGDVGRSGRLTGLRDFIEMTLGLFETANIVRMLLLSRTSSERPCGRSSNEIASVHSSPQLQVRYDTTLVAECRKPRRRHVSELSCLASVT